MLKKSKKKQTSRPCARCGSLGYAALPCFLKPAEEPAVIVCFKTCCVRCGYIPSYRVTSARGVEKIVPAVYAQDYFGRVRTDPCDFFLPRRFYENGFGKLDVAKKTDLCRAFLRLLLANPRRREFAEEELLTEWYR